MFTNRDFEVGFSVKAVKDARKAFRDFFAVENNLSRYARNVKLLATYRDMSLEGVGLAAGLNKFFVPRLVRKEKGCRNPKPDSVVAIAKVLGVSPSFLINGDAHQILCEGIKKAQEGVE